MKLKELISSLEDFRDNSPEKGDIHVIVSIDDDDRDITEISRYYFGDIKYLRIIGK